MPSLFTHHLGAHRSGHTLPPPTPSSVNTDLSRHTSIQSQSSRSATTWSPGLPQRSFPSRQNRPLPITPEHRAALEQQFPGLHADLVSDARLLLGQIQAIQQTLSGSLSETEKDEDIIAFLQNLVHGKISSALSPPASSRELDKGSHGQRLRPIRAVSRNIEARLTKNDRYGAIGLAIDDLRSAVGEDGDYPDEEREQRARDRIELIRAAMAEGDDYDKFWDEVTMHLDHELPIPACAEYSNQITFKAGVPVRAIPREQFLATNDGYAWDMAELAEEIIAKGGEYSNPITGRIFEEEDVELIKGHPLGRDIDDAVRAAAAAAAAQQQERTQGKAEMDGQGKDEERWEAKLSAQWAKQMHQNIRDKAEKEREASGLISGFGKLKLNVSSSTAAVELPSTTVSRSENVPSKPVQPEAPSQFPDYTTIAELPGSNESAPQPVVQRETAKNNNGFVNAGENEYGDDEWYNKAFSSIVL